MSRIIDPEDRGTAAVFADGAGAVLLSAAPSRAGSARSCSAPTASRPS